MSNSESGNNNDGNTNNSNNPSQPEYWESAETKLAAVDEDDPNYIDKVTNEVVEIINQVVEEFKKDK